MPEIKIFCLHCGQALECDEGYRGMQITCPTCNQSFLVPTGERQTRASFPNEWNTAKTSKNESRSGEVVGWLVFILFIAGVCWWTYSTIKGRLHEPAPWKPETTDWRAEHPLPQRQQMPIPVPSWLVVKGLYIGMPVSSLETAVKNKFCGDWQIENHPADTVQYFVIWSPHLADSKQVRKETLAHDLVSDNVHVLYDQSGNVTNIIFFNLAVDNLFSTGNLTADQFVQMFVNAYGIPTMKYHTGENNLYWEYTKDDILVRISTHKVVVLSKTLPQSEVQKNFN